MSLFVDQMLVQLSDPARLLQLLAPAADATHARLMSLVKAALTLEFATLHDVLNAQVVDNELARPIFPLERTHGTWTQTTPSYMRTDTSCEHSNVETPVWLDVAAAIGVTLVLEVDQGSVASLVTRELDNLTSLDDFRARFQYINVNAFLAQLGISTIEELRERYPVLVNVQLRPPPAFNPADPANQRPFTLGVAILIRDSLDISGALRDAKLARATVERTLAYKPSTDASDVRTPYAPILLFPASVLNGTPFTADSLQSFFAREHVLALFVTPA